MLTVTIEEERSGSIGVAEETYKKLGSPRQIELHFGQFHTNLTVMIERTQVDCLCLPGRVDNLTIPDLPYEVKWEEGELHLGPVIGFMNNAIFYNNPHWITSRFVNYTEIKGLIYIFGTENIDTKRKLVHGKYYNPRTNSFTSQLLPYPAALYLRTNPTPKLYRHLRENIGANKIFNYPFRSNKWVFWQCARQDKEIQQHLPDTCELNSVDTALAMLDKHGAVYLKPYSFSRGRGIFRLSREGHKLQLTDIDGRKWGVGSKQMLAKLLQEKLRTNYLVQQEIPIRHQEHKVDFRIYLQKDQAMRWVCRWVDTKVSIKGSIISNYRNRYTVMPGHEGIKMLFGVDTKVAQAKIDEIVEICIKTLNMLEKNAHSLGDVAIDFILDREQKIWLLEVQPDYYGDVFRLQYQTDYMHPHSLEYAKALAGFATEG